MNVLLFDDPVIRQQLLPLTYTRPVADLRIGMMTIAEKWPHYLKADFGFSTQTYLAGRFPGMPAEWWINGAVCPDESLVAEIMKLSAGQALMQENVLIAAHAPSTDWTPDDQALETIKCPVPVTLIDRPWKIFQLNRAEFEKDFELITRNRESAPLTDSHTVVYGRENLFLEEGAEVRAAIIDAEKGPVYLGKNSMVMEGAIIKGSLALMEHATVSIGAKLRGDSTIGPWCKAGGEVSNTVMHSYSNKSHDGFLGNAVIGQWCNLGADTNCSNMKNNYTPVKVYDHSTGRFTDTGGIFCGLIMGDHSKTGICTMLNTGTVVGVSANIYGSGFPRQFIPSFAWGGAGGFNTFRLDKAYETAAAMMGRREVELADDEKEIMKRIYEDTAPNRIWEKR